MNTHTFVGMQTTSMCSIGAHTNTDREAEPLRVPADKNIHMCKVHMYTFVPRLLIGEQRELSLKSESSTSTPQRSLSFPSSLQQSVTKKWVKKIQMKNSSN